MAETTGKMKLPEIPELKKVPKKRLKFFVLVGILAIAAATASVFFIQKELHDNKSIKVSGNIEGNDVRISFRVEGQIEELLADEGVVIKTSDVVAKLNTDELTKIKAENEAALRYAEYQYELDQLDYVRAENLFQAGAISAQKRDAAKTKADTDKANVEHARASLELANTRLGWADLASPLNGYILTKSAEEGEVVQVGAPVFTAIDLNDIWVTAYINEKDLGRVKLNQEAYVMTDSYKNKRYKGWVSFISQQTEFTPKYIQTTEERVKYVYRIKVRVDNSSLDLKPGMPADAFIKVN
ncbi:MAG: efflux RND transporter periplasmic adaptor subunit [Candidatus Omnitrophica bacterium]|nr:efflux RND transporter periplasmic adaptor subunit [Candidatus Omnitrophota bacterium]MDD5436242.1 efflux RND transporter periplasmic adaptor subunit [Candidatus Omnitrophota bacterium]